MMAEDSVLLDVDERGVAALTINRPEIHNAFDDALINRLLQALESVEMDPRVRVVILRAEGKSFSAGADLNWMRRMADYSEEENLADARIEFYGEGVVAEKQKPGWLTRILDNIWPF